MKVNMTPNPLDVVTIHASQGDTEARQWEFELHNNGELIDTSDVKEQLVFKAYKGGTEQLLPENTSTPTTSPFKGDIKYPQGLLADQEFTYRQSPTQSDGNAKIQAIYGNTLKWNQLAQLGAGSTNMCTKTYDSSTGITTITPTGYTSNGVGLYNVVRSSELKTSHRYIVSAEINPTADLLFSIGFGSTSFIKQLSANIFQNISAILTWREASLNLYGRVAESGWTSGTYQIKNVQCFDLTDMFGTEKAEEIYAMERAQSGSGIAYFHSLYPLSFYQYDSGSLLPFRGEGLKTVGKNLLEFDDNWESTTRVGVTATNNHDGTITLNGTATSANILILNFANASLSSTTQNDNKKHLQNGTYKVFGLSSGTNLQICESNVSDNSGTEATRLNNGGVITITNEYKYNWIRLYLFNGSSFDNTVISPMIMFEDVTDETFEPYTSHTTNLPVSTYFPTGMKSKGDVYDELTEAKAITRVGSRAYQSGDESDTSVITDGTTTYYALATPTETSFTTASLVTENAEIPLSNNDGVLIGKCTEELSAEPGFHDAKIRLADADGECYSNKIQLHVERSQQ